MAQLDINTKKSRIYSDSQLKAMAKHQLDINTNYQQKYKARQRQSHCRLCSLCTLFPDGAWRCDLTSRTVNPVLEACKQRVVGLAKVRYANTTKEVE